MTQIRNPFDAMHMSNTKAYEVQRTNHFEIMIVGIDGADIILAVNSAPLPTHTVSPIELHYGNANVKVAGKYTVENIELNVKDFILPDIEKKLYDWYQLVYNIQEGQMGWAEDYKRHGYHYQYGPDGNTVRVWELRGLWITTFNPGSDMDYTSSNAKSITATVAVDQAVRL